MNVRAWATGVILVMTLVACGGRPGQPPRLTPTVPVAPPPAAVIPLPTRLQIPSIGVDNNDFMSAGLDSHHELISSSLKEPKKIVWYSASPLPGDAPQCDFDDGCVQPSVLHAHINGNGVPGAFAKLAQVRKGAKIAVGRSDGKVAHYTVTKVLIFPKSEFPTKAVYGLAGPSLAMITCGPGGLEHTSEGGNYTEQTVVLAIQTAVTNTP